MTTRLDFERFALEYHRAVAALFLRLVEHLVCGNLRGRLGCRCCWRSVLSPQEEVHPDARQEREEFGYLNKEVRLMDVAARLKAGRAEVLRIAAQNGASNVRIFGSVARGEAKSDSDIVYLLLRLESVAAAFAQKCPLLPLLHQSGAVRTGLVPDA